MEVNEISARSVVRILRAKGLFIDRDENIRIFAWLKSLKLDYINEEELSEGYLHHKIAQLLLSFDGFPSDLPENDIEILLDWASTINVISYLTLPPETMIDSFTEYKRVRYRKAPPVRINYKILDQVAEDIEKPKFGDITFGNLDVKKNYIHADNFFSKNNDGVFSITLGYQNFDLSIKNIAEPIKNIKEIEMSRTTIPLPINIALDASDHVRLKIDEMSNFAHKEYPNIDYMFQFSIVLGPKLILTPINNRYRFKKTITQLNTLSFSFWYQNLKLLFPAVSLVGQVTFGNPVVITSPGHGLATGDKITIFDYNNSAMNSTFVATVTSANSFSLSVGIFSGYTMTRFYIQKNKIELGLEITWL